MDKTFLELKEGEVIYQLIFDKDNTLRPVTFQKIDVHEKNFTLFFYPYPIDAPKILCTATISKIFLNKDTSINFSLTTEERARNDMRINYLSHAHRLANEYHRKNYALNEYNKNFQ